PTAMRMPRPNGRKTRHAALAIGVMAAMLLAPLPALPQAGPAAPDHAIVERARQGDFYAHYQLGEFFGQRAAEGDLDRAIGHYREALARYERQPGAELSNIVALLDRIEAAQQALGRTDEVRAVIADRLARLRRAAPGS